MVLLSASNEAATRRRRVRGDAAPACLRAPDVCSLTKLPQYCSPVNCSLIFMSPTYGVSWDTQLELMTLVYILPSICRSVLIASLVPTMLQLPFRP